MRLLIAMAVGLAVWPVHAAARQIDGEWQGAIQVQGVELGIVVRFITGDSLTATIDIPQQGAAGVPLVAVRHDHPHVHFELPTPIGQAVFDGVMDGDSIRGDFTQSSAVATFYMTRGIPPATPEPEEDLPYLAEEVEFFNDTLRFTGTLTIPDGPGPHPAVVMITGSGAQNRDEELFGFKPFRVIADHFTRHGIAVLRYDDRGVGGSGGSVSTSTSDDFAGDVVAAVRFLRRDARMHRDRIGLVGHSEGGLVAPIATTRMPEIAFQVLLAGPALTGAEIIHAQGDLIMRADGADDAAVERFHHDQERVFEALRNDADSASMTALLRELTLRGLEDAPSDREVTTEQRENLVNSQVQAQLAQVQSPWFRYFITYDPRTALRQTRAPLLAVFGELDLQVPAETNRGEMERVLTETGHPDFSLRVLPRANHLFLTATTGSPSEYATMDKVFVPGFLELITEWITERTRMTP